MKRVFSFVLFVLIFGLVPVRAVRADEVPYQKANVGGNNAASLSEGKTPAEPPTVEKIGDKTITTTKYTDGSVGVKTEETTSDGTEIVSEKITEKDGSWAERTAEKAPDGSTVEKDETSDATGDNTYLKSVKTDKDGNVTETQTQTVSTDAAGVVTETTSFKNLNASLETEKVTQPDGDFILTTVMKDSDGNIMNSIYKTYEISETGLVTETNVVTLPDSVTRTETLTQPNGDSTSVSEKKDKEGNFINRVERSETVNPDNTISLSSTTTNADSSKTEISSRLDENGCGTITLSDTSAEGRKEEQNYSVTGESAVLDSLTTDSDMIMMPSEAVGIDGTRRVTEIGSDVLKGSKAGEVTIPESVKKVDAKAFEDAGIKVLRVQGRINKGMFGKNSLKGNGTAKNGKGMEIFVDSKKEAKALKKQLKKAGAKSAKVKVWQEEPDGGGLDQG